MQFVMTERTVTLPGRLYSKDEYITPFAPQTYEAEEKVRNEIPPSEAAVRKRKDTRDNIKIHESEETK